MSVASRLIPGAWLAEPGAEARRVPSAVERTLVVGTGALTRAVVNEIEARPALRAAVVGVVPDGTEKGESLPWVLAEALERAIDQTRPARIVVGVDDRRGRLPVRQLLEARTRGILVEDAVEAYERLTGKLALEALAPSSLAFSRGFRMSRLHAALARGLGLALATLGLVVLAPLLGLIAIMTRLDSSGPVFFVQERVGWRGRPFNLIKFRTMSPREHQTSEWEQDNCDRITRVGRWLRRCRLDELPQLVNVLLGDMNLVGPRPHPVTNLALLTLAARNLNDLSGEAIPYYSLRCAVRPGITGWAQVRYGYANSLEEELEKLRYDLYYVKHASLWLDLRILFETIRVVVSRRAAPAARAERVDTRDARAARRLSAA